MRFSRRNASALSLGVLRVDPQHDAAARGDLVVRALEQRHLRLARRAPRRPHVQHDDLACVVGQRAGAAGAEPRQVLDRRLDPLAVAQRLVQRRVRADRRDAVSQQRDQRRGGERDGPVDARAHALKGSGGRVHSGRPAGVVQWLRRWLPKPEMGVRFPSPALVGATARPPLRLRARPGPAAADGGQRDERRPPPHFPPWPYRGSRCGTSRSRAAAGSCCRGSTSRSARAR